MPPDLDMHLRTHRWAVRTPAPNQGTKGPHRESRRRMKAPTEIKGSATTRKKNKNEGDSTRGAFSNNTGEMTPPKKTQVTPTNRRSTLCFLLFGQSFTQCVCVGRRNPNKRKRIAGGPGLYAFFPTIHQIPGRSVIVSTPLPVPVPLSAQFCSSFPHIIHMLLFRPRLSFSLRPFIPAYTPASSSRSLPCHAPLLQQLTKPPRKFA